MHLIKACQNSQLLDNMTQCKIKTLERKLTISESYRIQSDQSRGVSKYNN